MEGELSYAWKGEVPEEEYLIPIGRGDCKKQGSDVSIISFSKPMRMCLAAAEKLEKEGVSAEVIDIRSIQPLDEEIIYKSVRKTNRCIVVDEAWPYASVGSHIGWLVSRNCFDYLDAPVELVASEEVPMPYNHKLELAAQPSVEKIVKAAKNTLYMEGS